MSESTPTYPSQGEYIARDSLRELLPNGYSPKGARLLFVHAHPDDESSSTGAAMAKSPIKLYKISKKHIL